MIQAEEFKKKGYIVVHSALHPELRDIITQYALFDEMQNYSPDGRQAPNAHAKYADPAMESMLLHLLPLIEEKTSLNLYPTYSYFRVYRNQDELTPHKDRPSCEISATACFNYSYKDYDWPIFMNGRALVLKPGDLAIYRGTDVEHWRLPLNVEEDAWHVQGFFHYVAKDGVNAEWKWDKRTSIGEKLK